MGRFQKNSEAAIRERLKYIAMRDAARSLALEEIKAALEGLQGAQSALLSTVGLFEVQQSDIESVELDWVDRKVDWDWGSQMDGFKKDPAHWNCALRLSAQVGKAVEGGVDTKYVLIALSAGSLSNSKITLRIEGLERRPDLDKVDYSWLTALMERAWYNYAISMECNKITLLEPHDRLIEKYSALGYTEWEDKPINGLSGLSKSLGDEQQGGSDDED